MAVLPHKPWVPSKNLENSNHCYNGGSIAATTALHSFTPEQEKILTISLITEFTASKT